MITPADAVELLTIAAAFDRRKIGKADAIAWADALAGLDIQDCAEAIRAHFRESDDYLMPVHVRRGVQAIRDVRIRAANAGLLEPHDVDPNDVAGYLAAKRERIYAVASGHPVTLEILAPADPERVAEMLNETLRALPRMPSAKPQADLEKKRLAGRS